jgi:ketol-acid reductoisomerase
MNAVISDTAEYGCYLFSHAAVPLLEDFMASVDTDIIGKGVEAKDNAADDRALIEVNAAIRNHPIESVGAILRGHMIAMKKVV